VVSKPSIRFKIKARRRPLLDELFGSKLSPKKFHTPTIYTKIPIADARRRTNRNDPARWIQVEFKIINKSEDPALTFHMDVGMGCRDHGPPGH
jgi:hypothetical protein